MSFWTLTHDRFGTYWLDIPLSFLGLMGIVFALGFAVGAGIVGLCWWLL